MAAPASRLTQNTLSSQASDTVHRLKEAVCQINTNHPGTGFLITPNCILTCCHVLPDLEVVHTAYACFSEVQIASRVAFNPDPSKNGFYHTSKLENRFTAEQLDFALVTLSKIIEQASNFFVLTDQFPPQKEQIHVIQHPVIEVTKRDPETGRALTVRQLTGEKRIATGEITDFDQYTIHYTAPVAGGSSGGPVINNRGHLYGIHHRECTNPAHKKCSNPEHSRSKNPVHKDCEILVNCGIGARTDAVFRYLRDHHIELDNFEELRQCSTLKAKYAQQSHLELVRPVRGYKDWMLQFPIDAIYTELVILRARIKKKEEQNRGVPSFRPDQGLETYETLFMDKESISKDKFFTTLKNSRKLLVLGSAGTGKTTFCQHLAFQWSTGSLLTEYQALFWIRLRHLKENETLEMLFQREFGFTPSDKHLRCALLILDGFDELPPYAEALFRKLTTQFQHVIVTSRPKTCIPFQSTIQLEIIGLDKTNSNTYIEHYFSELHNQHPEELAKEDVIPKAHRLQRLLFAHPLLASLAHIPVNLSLLCAIFSQEETFLTNQQSITVTALYHYIVKWMYSYFKIRQKELIPSTSTPSLIANIASQANPLSDPTVRSLDQFLSKIALNYTQNSKIVSNQEELENLLVDQNASLEVNQLNDSGLFRVDLGQGEFIHLSYQDFFVARHLVNLYTANQRKQAQNQRKQAQNFVKAYKLQERYKWIFWMAAGLLSIEHPKILPLYFEDLHTLARDLGQSYELRLLARCYEECLHPEVLPKYSEFLKDVLKYLKEHPSSNSKAEFSRDCPRLLFQPKVIETVRKFPAEQLKNFIMEIAEMHQCIPEIILEKICENSNDWRKEADILIALYSVVESSSQMLSKPCLKFVCSFFKQRDSNDNYSIAYGILSEMLKHQEKTQNSFDDTIEWLKSLKLPNDIKFCLFVERLKIHEKYPDTLEVLIEKGFGTHAIGKFLKLSTHSIQEIFNELLTRDTFDLIYKSGMDSSSVSTLISYLLQIKSIDSSQAITNLVNLALEGYFIAAQTLAKILSINYSITDDQINELIEYTDRDIEFIDSESDDSESVDNKSDNESLDGESNDISIDNKSDSESIDSESHESESVDNKSDNESLDGESDDISIDSKSDSESIDSESDNNEFRDCLSKILSKIVKKDHRLSSKILELLKKHCCLDALVEITLAENRHSEKAFQIILDDIESYHSIYNTAHLWSLDELLKPPYIERIVEALLTLFHSCQSLNSVTNALSEFVLTDYFFSIKTIDSFIQFIMDKDAVRIEAIKKNAKKQIEDILRRLIKTGHPDSLTILKIIENKLKTKDLRLASRVSFANIIAEGLAYKPTFNVIEMLVSCIPTSNLKMLTNSCYEIEIKENGNKKFDSIIRKFGFILQFILRQDSIRLSSNTIHNLLNLLKQHSQESGQTTIDEEDIQNIIAILSLLKYSDYQRESQNLQLFTQIAYLTGQPFIEAEQG